VPQVLTTNALIVCPHAGIGTSVSLNPIWDVNGGQVLAEGDTGTLSCINIVPCVGYTLKSMRLNSTFIGPMRAILVTDFNQSFTGLPLQMTEFHQTYDESTPGPVPAGQSAPPPSPAMADLVPPIVTVAPPSVAFSQTTQMPAVVPITFTLTSPNPLQWILTLINDSQVLNLDLTNGMPPGVVVAPSGGAWNSPSLAVVVTLTAAFMNSLAPPGGPPSHLYMTAVSKRGLSGRAVADITVVT
jgi:hypothetical protein